MSMIVDKVWSDAQLNGGGNGQIDGDDDTENRLCPAIAKGGEVWYNQREAKPDGDP